MPALRVRMDGVKDDEMEVPEDTEGSDGATLMQFLTVKVRWEWKRGKNFEVTG